MEIMLESMMVAERGEFLADNPGNKGNGYRPGSTYGQGRKLEFRTGQRDYTVETAWTKWQEMCDKWGKDYRAIKLLRNSADYKAYMTYLNYAPEIQAMIYTTNWIERLNRDFRRVTRMRTAMPNEESVLTLMGSVAMDHKAFDRALPNITVDKALFPD